MSVEDALDRLVPECRYAVVVGVENLQYPTLVVDAESSPDATAGEEAADDTLLATVLPTISTTTSSTRSRKPSPTRRSSRSSRASSSRRRQIWPVRSRPSRDVRAKDDEDDAPTQYLEFEKYEGVADERMASLEAELEERDGVLAVELFHRTGVVEDGEDIVFVVVLAGHRTEAFRTVEDGINRLKDEVPLFKRRSRSKTSSGFTNDSRLIFEGCSRIQRLTRRDECIIAVNVWAAIID